MKMSLGNIKRTWQDFDLSIELRKEVKGDVYWLIAEVERLRRIEDVSVTCGNIMIDVDSYEELDHVEVCDAIDSIFQVVKANPRPESADV